MCHIRLPAECRVKRPIEDTLEPVAAILYTGGPGVIRKAAWPSYKTISGVCLCKELEEPKGPKEGPCAHRVRARL